MKKPFEIPQPPWHELYVFASSDLDEAGLKALADDMMQRYKGDVLIVVYNPASNASRFVPGPDTVQ